MLPIEAGGEDRVGAPNEWGNRREERGEKGCADALLFVRGENEELVEIEKGGLFPEQGGGGDCPVHGVHRHTAARAEKATEERVGVGPWFFKAVDHVVEEGALMKGTEVGPGEEVERHGLEGWTRLGGQG